MAEMEALERCCNYQSQCYPIAALYQVVIAAIEPGSPASDDADVIVGLALATVNGAALLSGGARMLKKAWRALLAEPCISLECVL